MDIKQTISQHKKVIGIFLSSLLLCLVVFPTRHFYFTTYAALAVFIVILVYSLKSVRTRLALLLFDLLIFLFLLGRPLIDQWSNYETYNPARYSFEQGIYASQMILVSLLGLLIGHVIYEQYLLKLKPKIKVPLIDDPGLRIWLERIALGGFILGIIAMAMVNIEKVTFRQSNDYAALYSSFKTQLPFLVIGFSKVAVTFLVLFLAVTKRIKTTVAVLGVYLLVTAIVVPIGQRAPMGRALIFAFFVLFMKVAWRKGNNKKLIKSLLIGFLVLVGILTPVFYKIGVYRWGDEAGVEESNKFLHFVHGQSVSYQVLAYGPDLLKDPKHAAKQYTFGPFLDQYINDLPENPYTQEYLDNSDSFAADMGYFLLKSQYFRGKGMGSSYMIEVYAEFGHIGLYIYSLLLGILLASLSNLKWENLPLDLIKIHILTDIFYIPRAQATRFLVNLTTPKFLLPILCSFVLAWVLTKYISREVKL